MWAPLNYTALVLLFKLSKYDQGSLSQYGQSISGVYQLKRLVLDSGFGVTDVLKNYSRKSFTQKNETEI